MVVTCFYCSSHATEEVVTSLEGEEVFLRLCRLHARSQRGAAGKQSAKGRGSLALGWRPARRVRHAAD